MLLTKKMQVVVLLLKLTFKIVAISSKVKFHLLQNHSYVTVVNIYMANGKELQIPS